MVVIRLALRGAKHQPSYHVVAADRRNPRDGRFIEKLGFYNPISDALNLKLERIDYWISQGAQPSDRVKLLLKAFKKAKPAVEVSTSAVPVTPAALAADSVSNS